MIDYTSLYERLAGSPLEPWIESLPAAVSAALDPRRHGDLPGWIEAIERLPAFAPTSADLTASAVRAGCETDLSRADRAVLKERLDAFHPWRKGPFSLYGIYIDTEWRSDWKWDRLDSAIAPLRGRRVLDVGAGNGYYGWRMRGAGAELVVGIDPYLLYVMQYDVVRRALGGDFPVFVLPLGIESLPDTLTGFDTVFSMGVLSHRRSPLDHLRRLLRLLAPDGELVLETLVVEGREGDVLDLKGRYARMHNVWQIPSPATLVSWLERCSYRSVCLVDVSTTSVQEQRSTAWMRFESLADCLDPDDASLTIEGHPAPRRAIVTARKPLH